MSGTGIDDTCERCRGEILGSWIIKDGKRYHGPCLPVMATDRVYDADRLANIDRLTAQVAELKAMVEMYKNRWQTSVDETHEQTVNLRRARTDFARLQESLTACEQERDEARARAEYLLMDRDNAESKRVELRERVGALEGAAREYRRENGFDHDEDESGNCLGDCNACKFNRVIDARALTPAPPAERPAPTCNCVHCGLESEAPFVFCPKCGECTPATAPPVARDASVDAPMLDDERKQLCDKINEWKRRYFLVADAVAAESESAEQLAGIAYKTRQDLAAANEEIARLEMVAHERAEEVNTSYERGCREGAACATHNARERREALTAKLGRAEARIAELEAQLEQRK